MSITDLNANVGIDFGTHTSKLAYEDKAVESLEGFDFLALREKSEIYFDEPVFSCVVAVPDSLGRHQREDLIFNSKKSGFKYIDLISSDEAILNALEDKNKKILVYDFGASKSEIIFFEDGKVLDKEIIRDVSGSEFDKIFASWLRERFSLSLIKENEMLAQAEKFKCGLSFKDSLTWRGIEITREDFERLIFFSVRRAAHTVERFINCYAPEKFIMTGGCIEIPVVRKIFIELNSKTEFNKNLIALGTAVKAGVLSSKKSRAKHKNTAERLSKLRGALIELEDLLTRKQKDRLYFLVRQTEGFLTSSPNDTAIINLMENLVKEISASASQN